LPYIDTSVPQASQRTPRIWLLQDGEPLPTDDNPRLMRTGDLALRLVADGFDVTWWTSRFNHGLKQYRNSPPGFVPLGDRYRLCLLDGPSYKRNLSLRRVQHYRALAADFGRRADAEARPDLVLASFPSPEMAYAGMTFARRHGLPFVVDIRDPWPDIFHAYFHPLASWSLAPILWYYRRMTRPVMQSAASILAVTDSMLAWGIDYAGRERRDRDRVFMIGYNKPQVERPIVVPDEFTEAAPLVCLFASTCGNSYDGRMVVEAARLLEASGERRVSFVLSGDGERRREWMDLAAGLTTVRFTGWISNDALQQLFATSHVGLVLMHGGITPFWLGNKFGEYLSTSLALINNVAGEAAGMVTRHGLGLNVTARDPRAVADAVRRLLASPVTVRQSMTNARDVFNGVFDRSRIYDHYVRFLHEAITGHVRPSP